MPRHTYKLGVTDVPFRPGESGVDRRWRALLGPGSFTEYREPVAGAFRSLTTKKSEGARIPVRTPSDLTPTETRSRSVGRDRN